MKNHRATSHRSTDLTPQQARFVQEYLIDHSAVAAAIRAGYSKKSAAAQGCQLLNKPKIREAIKAAEAVILSRVRISAEKTLNELGKIAFADLRNVFDEHGRLIPPSQWPDTVAGAISSIKVKQITDGEDAEGNPIGAQVIEMKLWDKVSALNSLGKHFGLLVDKTEETHIIRFESMSQNDIVRFLEDQIGEATLSKLMDAIAIPRSSPPARDLNVIDVEPQPAPRVAPPPPEA
jgi:phage terminase small subunit